MSATQIRPLGTLGKNAWPPLVVSLAAIGLAISALLSSGGNAILERAVEASASQDSYRFTLEQSAGASGQTVIGLKMDGFYDRASGLSRFTLSFGGAAGLNECTVIGDDNTWFVQIPEERRGSFGGKAWIRSAPLTGSPAQGLASSPARGEPFVDLDVIDNLEEIGSESVRGVAATHYRGTIDFAATLARVDASPMLKQQLERLRIPDRIPIDFWIDGDDRIRRTSFSFAVPSGPVRVETKLQAEAYDFGVDEPVMAPAQSDVAEATEASGFAACLAPASPLNR